MLFQAHECLYVAVRCFSCMNACTWQFAVSAAWMLVLGNSLFQLCECLLTVDSAAWMLVWDVAMLMPQLCLCMAVCYFGLLDGYVSFLICYCKKITFSDFEAFIRAIRW
jgi:hypothetical protein